MILKSYLIFMVICNNLNELRLHFTKKKKVNVRLTFCVRVPHSLVQGNKTHPLIFIVGTNNVVEYLQRYLILIFIYYKFYFIIFIVIQHTFYVEKTVLKWRDARIARTHTETF